MLRGGKILSVDLSKVYISGEVLDIGCSGNGIIYRALKSGHQHGMEETAFTSDSSISMETPDWVYGKPDDLPFDDRSFDNITAFFSFSQIRSRHGRNKTIKEISRVLKPDGKLYIWDINKGLPLPWLREKVSALLPGGDRAEMDIAMPGIPWSYEGDDMVPMIERFFSIDVFIKYEGYFFIEAAKKEG